MDALNHRNLLVSLSDTTLESRCARFTQDKLTCLANGLPSAFSQLALGVRDSSQGWEWKHYWAQGATLWLEQTASTAKLHNGGWSSLHDSVFERWNRSEYAQDLMAALAETDDLKYASRQCAKTLVTQLKGVASNHFGLGGAVRGYRPQFELGEFKGLKTSSRIATSQGTSVEFLSWDTTHFNNHADAITQALALVKTHSPASYRWFKLFTKRVIPIRQRELVSYSLQDLPGHSFINMYHRDRVDLLDDLMHENGHHHLNLRLILGNLLREDPDQIYYSPWRRTLRPIRGIFHAHFTFFFALKLFHDLAEKLLDGELNWPGSLNAREKRKILFRYAEEAAMLGYSAEDLERARARGQITPAGWLVVQAVESARHGTLALYHRVRRALDREGLDKLLDLEKELKRQARLNRGS